MAELTVSRFDIGTYTTSLDILVRAAAAQLDAVGVNWRPLADQYGLRLEGEPVEGARITTWQEHAFLKDASLASGDPLFLWRVGNLSVREFGLIGYAALNAPSVRAALDIFAAVLPIVRESATLHTVVDGNMACLVGVNAAVPQTGLLGLRVVLNLLRELIGPEFAATRVGLPVHEDVDLNAVTKQVGAPLAHDLPYSFVTFALRHMNARVAYADERLAGTLRPYWQPQAQEMARSPNVVRSRIESAVVQHLQFGAPTQAQLAEHLQMPLGVLETQMAAFGGVRGLVDGVRRKLAQDLVRRTDLSFSRVAELLGYSEPSSFNHAYRRWTGGPPKTDRRHAAIKAEAPVPGTNNAL